VRENRDKQRKKLVAVLEGDIQTWEVEAEFFERLVNEIDMIGDEKISRTEYLHAVCVCGFAEHREPRVRAWLVHPAPRPPRGR
jgi:hypothetical protein